MNRTVSCYNLRAASLFVCLAGFLFTTFASRALADDHGANPAVTYTTAAQGSAPIRRSLVDTSSGQVYVYTGGLLPAGSHLATLQYMFDFTQEGNTTGFITPILFEATTVEGFTIYTVAGIGKSFGVKLAPGLQAIPFNIIEGKSVTTDGSFTFGFINAMVNSNGVPVAISPGTVDMNDPANTGQGTGGVGTTNNWAATATSAPPSPVVTLGTTFGGPGSSVAFTFVPPYRTYSAQAYVTVVIP
jgi:hypothetical protein